MSKGHPAKVFHRFKVSEAIRVARIDYRAKKHDKEDEEERDDVQGGYTFTEDGDRVWSF